MQGKEFHGRSLKVEAATGTDRTQISYSDRDRDRGSSATSNLFVANIPSAVEEEDLYNHFEKFGKGRVSFPLFLVLGL